MSDHPAIATLHEVIEGRTPAIALAEWIADNAVFHSPVMHTPQVGKAKVMQYLGAAFAMFSQHGFAYRREIVDGHDIVLEFTAEMGGIHINGVDIITLDKDGKIIDFKVMIRPLKAIEAVRETMLEMLEASRGR